ncbi:MAG TPA: nicotianamine synthase family protein [Candidatus Sulfotelmatobacter sp.]|jgi:protein-L-isoaspartate O-methyltransferase|nr:nicotianamine synthase family protein [Candidatus Sulfotelmatobacter sp.]
MSTEKNQPDLSFLALDHARRVQEMETDFAKRVINGTPVEEYYNYGVASRLVEAEADLAGITPGENVLFIGSGPFPSSAICLARQRDVSVTCYDLSSDAYQISTAVIEKIGLADKIKVAQVSGADGSMSGYDAIIVAFELMNKPAVLTNILANVDPDARVIIRSSDGNRKSLYPAVTDKDLAGGITRKGLIPTGSRVKLPDFDIASRCYIRPSSSGKTQT